MNASFWNERFGLAGRCALVTGGNRGIGRAVAEALAGAGAEVAVHYHRGNQEAEATVASIQKNGGKAWPVGANLADAAGARDLAREIEKRWGRLDLLINNAGDMVGRAELAETSDDFLRSVLAINLESVLRVTRAAIPLLKKGTGAAIVNTTSIAAHNGGVRGVSVYAAAKGGILSLTRSLARELAPQIRVNAISPGLILTDLHKKHSTEDGLRAIAENTPLRRNGTPGDCAGAVLFLCGPSASFITGEVIEINGGLWMS